MGFKDLIRRFNNSEVCTETGAGLPHSAEVDVVEDGGRFGFPTDIIGGIRPYSSEMNLAAVDAALDLCLDFDVVGESFRPGYPQNLLQLAETLRTMSGPEYLTVELRRDPSNDYDRNAIEVHVVSGAGFVGFVPTELASILTPLIDDGEQLMAQAVEVRVNPSRPENPGLTVSVKRASSRCL